MQSKIESGHVAYFRAQHAIKMQKRQVGLQAAEKPKTKIDAVPSWNGNARAGEPGDPAPSICPLVRQSVQRLRLEQVCQAARLPGCRDVYVCVLRSVWVYACWFNVKLVGFLRFVNIPPASCRCICIRIRRLLLRLLSRSRGVQIIADGLSG